jgi:NhaP-type Na+/H+ or K+/H+ antiporter
MPSAERVNRFRVRLRRLVADIDFLLAHALGRREGTIIVWAGMRGAITLAAQTLPEGTPSRSLLILVAFLVATSSLLLQGGTLAPPTGRRGRVRRPR